MVEGARLESVCTGNRTVGSNPTLSAQILSFRFNSLQATREFPVQRSLTGAFGCAENRDGDREMR